MNRKEAIKKWDEIIQEVELKKSELDNLLGAARQINDQLNVLMTDSNSKLNAINSSEQQINQKVQETEQKNSSVAEKEREANERLNRISKIEEGAIAEKTKIDELSNRTDELLKRNNEQSEKVSDMLQKAAAGSLFNSFNLRKTEHEKASKFWMYMIGASVLILVIIAGWLAWLSHVKGILSYEFLLKLSLSFPVIYWLIFSTRQYVKTKRFEEEYAFKSAISLSLEAYRDLIKKESGEPVTKTDVIPFITEAVGKIFSSPSVIISKNPHKEDSDITEGILDKLLQLISKIKGS